MHQEDPDEEIRGEHRDAPRLDVRQRLVRHRFAVLHRGPLCLQTLARRIPQLRHRLQDERGRGDGNHQHDCRGQPFAQDAGSRVLQQEEHALAKCVGHRQERVSDSEPRPAVGYPQSVDRLCRVVADVPVELSPSRRFRDPHSRPTVHRDPALVNDVEVLPHDTDGHRQDDDANVKARHTDDLANPRRRAVVTIANGGDGDGDPPEPVRH
mmetsp:Transcript_80801/g.233672  ORF Transcript_80801/g.233672 Transcript_80801/m.233672 type:complete len:210 (+) Transcript_80801:878-1507(+)